MPVEINKNMTVAEIFELAPDSVIIMQNAGLKCTGCDARTDRQLQELMADKNFNQEQEEKMLIHLNKLKQVEENLPTPQAHDFQTQEIQEGNKKYYKIAGMMLTESAYQNLHQLATESGLQIRLSTGGCSGFKYDYDFKNQPAEDEKTYALSPQLSIYLNDFTFGRTAGSIIEFKLGLHESGLQIINPNKKRSCSCGTSIAF